MINVTETRDEQIDRLKRTQAAFVSLVDTDVGKLILADLARFCGFFKSSYSPLADIKDSRTFFEEGKREVYLHIHNYLSYTPEEFKKIVEGKNHGDEYTDRDGNYSDIG